MISSSEAYTKSLWIYHLILVHLVKVQREFAVMTTGNTVLQSLGLTMATFNVSLIIYLLNISLILITGFGHIKDPILYEIAQEQRSGGHTSGSTW